MENSWLDYLLLVFVTRWVFGLRVFFLELLDGQLVNQFSLVFFVSRVFHVATAHCKPCVTYAGMCM